MYNILAKTLFLGQNVIQLDFCESTNESLKIIINSTKTLEGTVLISPNQTKGKGQVGNSWYSEKSLNMTFSILLTPKFIPIGNSFYLSIITSLAIYDFLTLFIKSDIKIKWPNDIYVNKRKIAGVLIENNISNNNISQSIVGIGININQLDFKEIANKTTSLKLISEKDYDIAELYGLFFECFEKRYLQARKTDISILKMEYLANLLFYQENAFFEIEDKKIEANVVGVDNNGKLALSINNELKYFDLKEIKWVIN